MTTPGIKVISMHQRRVKRFQDGNRTVCTCDWYQPVDYDEHLSDVLRSNGWTPPPSNEKEEN